MSNLKPVFHLRRAKSDVYSSAPSRPYMPERADGEIEWVFSGAESGAFPRPRETAQLEASNATQTEAHN